MRQASWCDPAGGRPAQVRGSARLVASVAWSLATCGQRPAGGSAERVKAGVGPSVDHQHRRLRGAGAEPVQGFLAVKTMKLPQPPLTAIEFNTALREARFGVEHARIVDMSGRCPGFATTPAFRGRALDRPRTLGDPRTRGRDRAAGERSLARFLQSVARAQPRPPPHPRFTDRVLWGMRQRGDGRMARRLFALLVPTPSPQPRLPLSAVSNLAQIGRRESATMPHGES